MITIKHIHEHLGAGVFSMECGCVDEDFLVNTRETCPVNYTPHSKLVRCPWCKIEVGVGVIIDNFYNKKIAEELK